MKKNINVSSEQLSKFTSWMYENVILYGDPWLKWWKKEGMEAFAKWNQKEVSR